MTFAARLFVIIVFLLTIASAYGLYLAVIGEL